MRIYAIRLTLLLSLISLACGGGGSKKSSDKPDSPNLTEGLTEAEKKFNATALYKQGTDTADFPTLLDPEDTAAFKFVAQQEFAAENGFSVFNIQEGKIIPLDATDVDINKPMCLIDTGKTLKAGDSLTVQSIILDKSMLTFTRTGSGAENREKIIVSFYFTSGGDTFIECQLEPADVEAKDFTIGDLKTAFGSLLSIEP